MFFEIFLELFVKFSVYFGIPIILFGMFRFYQVFLRKRG